MEPATIHPNPRVRPYERDFVMQRCFRIRNTFITYYNISTLECNITYILLYMIVHRCIAFPSNAIGHTMCTGSSYLKTEWMLMGKHCKENGKRMDRTLNSSRTKHKKASIDFVHVYLPLDIVQGHIYTID